MPRLLMAAAAALTLAMPVRADDEEKVPLDKVPKPVIEAVKKRFPKAELVSASKEDENGKIVYEVQIKDGGAAIDVTATPEGALVSVEKEIAAKDLPKAVAKTLDEKYPKAEYKTVEEIIKVKDGKDEPAYYEVLLVTADKKTLEVEIAADGKVIATEDKKAEDKAEKVPFDKIPKAVMDAVKARFPDAELTSAEKETADGKVVYDIELKSKGRKAEMDILEDGTVLEVELEVPLKDVPEAVTKAVLARFPGATIEDVMEVRPVKNKEEKASHYEITIKTADKKELELIVSLDGKSVKTEDEVKKEEKEKKDKK